MQRKVLAPNEIEDLPTLQQRLLDFETHYAQAATPFAWQFTRNDLTQLLAKLHQQERERQQLRLAA